MLVLKLPLGIGWRVDHRPEWPVALNLTVYKVKTPPRTVGKLLIVGNDNNGLVQLLVQSVKKLIDIIG